MKIQLKRNMVILCVLSLILFQFPNSILAATYTPSVIKHIPNTGARLRIYDNYGSYKEVYWMDGIDKVSVENEIAFCIEPNTIGTGGTYSKHSNINTDLIMRLSRIVYYAWDTSNKTDIDYALTQYMIWEEVGAIIMQWYGSFANQYNSLKQKVNEKIKLHTKKPSFTNTSYTVKAGDTLTLKDTNNVLNSFHITSNTAKNITINNNALTINTDENTPDNIQIKLQKVLNKNVGASIIYRSSADDGQDVGVFRVSDPISLTLDINVEKKGNLRIIKEDENNNRIKDVSFLISRNEFMKDPIGTYKTNEEGIIEINDLEAATYYVKEVNVPYYLNIDTKVYPLKVEANKTCEHTIYNPLVKTTIQVKKIADVVKDFDNNEFIYEKQGLENVEFTIYAAKDIYHPITNQLLYKKDDTVDIGYSNSDGMFYSKPLVIADYYIKETKTIDGYKLNENRYDVSLKYDYTNKDMTSELVTIENKLPKITLKFNKIFETSIYNNYETVNHCEFGIYTKEDLYVKNQLIAPKDTCLKTIRIEDVSSFYLPDGKYYLKETKTHPAYILDSTLYSFNINHNSEDSIIQIEEDIVNCLNKINLRIVKTDDNNEPILDSVFKFNLYKEYECKTLIRSYESSNGYIEINDLPYGSYYLKEIIAPKGYRKKTNVLKIQSNENGVIIDEHPIFKTNNQYSYNFINHKIPITSDSTPKNTISLLLFSLVYIVYKFYKK